MKKYDSSQLSLAALFLVFAGGIFASVYFGAQPGLVVLGAISLLASFGLIGLIVLRPQ